MTEPSDDALRAAMARGDDLARVEPRARAVRYDASVGAIIIDFVNGCSLTIPAPLIQGLGDASPVERAEMELWDGGYALRWPLLDLDFAIPDLAAGLFGTRSWMARQAGKSRSEAKSTASRTNGKKGGRPKTSAA